ncbi:MAG: ROK family protein [Propionibacteriaceae bacterium]|nr:ROK family protein [Propionibacteriaceae bacterium]
MSSRVPRAASAGRSRIRPQDGRQNNLSLVLQTLYDTPEISRADLSRATGLTRVTISDLVAELLGSGLLAEVGSSDAIRPGKPATLLTVAEYSRDIIAVDLSGGEAITGAICNIGGKIRYRAERQLGDAKGEEVLRSLISFISELVKKSDKEILGICVGTPGTVDPSGKEVSAANLDWHRLKLSAELGKALGQDVTIANDARLATIAEHRFGNAGADLIRVQISRGVGSGLLIGGIAVNGTGGAAGEIGHVVIEHNGALCSCGKHGCLETWVAVPALSKRIAENPAEKEEILAEAGRRLGIALAPIIGMLDVSDVIVGGPSQFINGTFIAAAQSLIIDRIGLESRRSVVLRESQLAGDAVLLGATALILRKQLGVN